MSDNQLNLLMQQSRINGLFESEMDKYYKELKRESGELMQALNAGKVSEGYMDRVSTLGHMMSAVEHLKRKLEQIKATSL